LGDHRICCGNVRDIETSRLLCSQGVADLVFTDPPYNLPINGHVRPVTSRFNEFDEASGEMNPAKFTDFLKSYLTVALKVTRPGALFYSFMDWRHLREMIAAVDVVELELINICC
jgi:DNA modification methylase